ncbi:Hexapeptide repeat of succinyl-transferase [Pedobacter westerhofensis]|uniref:Hexapeptide repeat of succinyl-transferase n=1 Tax=Pedobacter westerhofensis TaxID=425512 RepID=A0A521C5Y7_9SPHI|nr:acyltransferase [Pedobacter westerhofensis]SMO54814.1 Hexapeptide repeat of succinyl-transferase [Pedobacter westerhofensis]
MKKHFLALLRHKSLSLRESLRIVYYKSLGLSVNGNVKLGKIRCNWPNNVKLGNNCDIEDGVLFKITQPFSGLNYIQLGDNVFVGADCQFNSSTQIIVGNDCLIASNTTFVDTGHENVLGTLINKQPCNFEKIVLGEDVWIGTHCSILKGVTIGNGSIIGAGSVVNKSIPANQIWAGVPARFIRNR